MGTLALVNTISLLAVAAPSADPCAEARGHYEALDPEQAIAIADAALAQRPDLMDCRVVRALSALVLSRLPEARADFREIFESSPQRPIEDPSLSPALLAVIEAERAEAQQMDVALRARWLTYESARIDIVVSGGLRGARALTYSTSTRPAGSVESGEVALIGRAATATVSVTAEGDVTHMELAGVVVDRTGASLHEFVRVLPMVARPPPADRESVVVVDEGVPWPVWLAVGLGAAGAVAAIVVLAQPGLPNTDGTLGAVEVFQ